MPVYLDYDQSALDAQYNLRPLVPTHPEIFKRYIRDSTAVREQHACHLDIVYDPQSDEALDIFPARATVATGPSPVLVFIHGGYWRAKDKFDFSYLAPAYTQAGYHLVLVNYTLAPDAGMDEIVRQNRTALVWLWRNVAQYGGDPDRIFVSGHSAGGHLTAMMMNTDWAGFDGGEGTPCPDDVIKGGIAISGLFDLEPIRLCYLNESLHMDQNTAHRNSPLHHIRDVQAPLILALGGLETDEYHRQQSCFHAAWEARGLKVQVVEMPGLHHYDVIDHLGMPGSALFSAACAMMECP